MIWDHIALNFHEFWKLKVTFWINFLRKTYNFRMHSSSILNNFGNFLRKYDKSLNNLENIV
jgi:hypothetical protein